MIVALMLQFLAKRNTDLQTVRPAELHSAE
jgi:hypothetical protein